MRVHRRRAAVRYPVDVLAPTAARGCRANERDVHPRRHIEELEAHVTPRQCIVVVLRPAAACPAVDGAERREVGTVPEYVTSRSFNLSVSVVEFGSKCTNADVEGVLDEVGEIVDLIVTQAQAAWRAGPAGVREAGRERACRGGLRVLRHTGVEVLHHLRDACGQAIMEKNLSSLGLPQRQRAEPKGVAVAERDFAPALIEVIRLVPRRAIQGLERVIGSPRLKKVCSTN